MLSNYKLDLIQEENHILPFETDVSLSGEVSVQQQIEMAQSTGRGNRLSQRRISVLNREVGSLESRLLMAQRRNSLVEDFIE